MRCSVRRATLYLDLLEQTLTGAILQDSGVRPHLGETTAVESVGYDREMRRKGMDWTTHACTMVGLERLRNLRRLVARVIQDGTPGDLLEAGVWRGGASIYMRALLAAYGVKDRRVWVVDLSPDFRRQMMWNFRRTTALDCTSSATWRCRWKK
jgi:hypothetical protein